MTSDIIYDARSEVTGVNLNTVDYAYAYDNIGNHTTSSVNSVSTTYTANSLNQYSEISVPSVPSVDNLSYDLDGNLLTNGVWSYTWDAENRLATAYSNSVCVISNAYDYMSRRVLKVTPTATHTFIYDGWNLIQESIATASGVATNNYRQGFIWHDAGRWRHGWAPCCVAKRNVVLPVRNRLWAISFYFDRYAYEIVPNPSRFPHTEGGRTFLV